MPFATVTGEMLAQSKPLAGPSGEETAIAGIEQAFVASLSHRLAAEAEILPPLVASGASPGARRIAIYVRTSTKRRSPGCCRSNTASDIFLRGLPGAARP